MTLTGPHLAPASGGAPSAIVVLLHGYGSNGADLLSFAPIWARSLPDALFLAPNAPERCPGAPGGYQWWGLHDLALPALAAGAARAAPELDAFLDAQLAEHGLGNDRLVLAGFSQGTMMALHVGLRRTPAVAGIIGYSGLLAAAPAPGDIVARPPILLIHGDRDPTVPVTAYHASHAALHRLGYAVEGGVTPGLGHSVDLAGIERGAAFARRALGDA